MKNPLAAALAVALSVVDVGHSAEGMALARPEAATAPPLARMATAPAPGSPDPVVLVVLDGVRWQEIVQGTDPSLAAGTPLARRDAASLMPNLHRMATADGARLGGSGRHAMRASGPNFVSLPSYREILTGRSTGDCTDNECARIMRTTLVDELRASGRTAAVFASWEKIALAATSRDDGALVSAGRSEGDDTDPYPGAGAFRRDAVTAEIALRHLERERPDFLFLGLGETDEYAHHGDYAGYVGALEEADRVLGDLRALLGRMGERGARTHVLVTTDHGRSAGFRDHGKRYPESARVWLVATGPRIEGRGDVSTSTERRLRDVAPTIRLVAGLSPALDSGDEGTPLAELFGRR